MCAGGRGGREQDQSARQPVLPRLIQTEEGARIGDHGEQQPAADCGQDRAPAAVDAPPPRTTPVTLDSV